MFRRRTPRAQSAEGWNSTVASYDGSGNVTSLFTLTSFEYDPFNRVTHLVGTGVNKSFLYDTSDNRVAILDHQAQTEEWHLRGLHDKVVRSFLSSPEGWSWKQDWVYRDGQLVGSTAPAKWREYHLDHLGSPRLVTGPIGLKVAEYHPFPFGEMASENGPGVDEGENLFRYTGHERDVNCEDGSCAPEGQDDLDYMLARFYSPVMGRFLAVDPINSGKVDSPQSWNRYLYARSSPLKFVDPAGEDVSIAITFVDGINEEEREKIMDAVRGFWLSLNVGKVFVFDSAKFKHGGGLLAFFKGGRASITVDPSQRGRSVRELVRADEYLSRDDLTRDQKIQAIANAINHEIFNHQFHIGPYSDADTVTFDRRYDKPNLVPDIRHRYGTVQDAYVFADPRFRPGFVNGPVPVFEEDAEEAARELGQISLDPPVPRN